MALAPASTPGKFSLGGKASVTAAELHHTNRSEAFNQIHKHHSFDKCGGLDKNALISSYI